LLSSSNGDFEFCRDVIARVEKEFWGSWKRNNQLIQDWKYETTHCYRSDWFGVLLSWVKNSARIYIFNLGWVGTIFKMFIVERSMVQSRHINTDAS
jgi:hypothetical protein